MLKQYSENDMKTRIWNSTANNQEKFNELKNVVSIKLHVQLRQRKAFDVWMSAE